MDSEEEMLENLALLADDLDLAVIDSLIEQIKAGIETIAHRKCRDLDLEDLATKFMRKLLAYRDKQF